MQCKSLWIKSSANCINVNKYAKYYLYYIFVCEIAHVFPHLWLLWMLCHQFTHKKINYKQMNRICLILKLCFSGVMDTDYWGEIKQCYIYKRSRSGYKKKKKLDLQHCSICVKNCGAQRFCVKVLMWSIVWVWLYFVTSRKHVFLYEYTVCVSAYSYLSMYVCVEHK